MTPRGSEPDWSGREGFHFLPSVQTKRSVTPLYTPASVSLFLEDSSRNGRATPPLPIHHNQICSGLSTRFSGDHLFEANT
ncbi:unnamed protein product [Pleuronectes platessa]|uniref:Uncharacterized protein n=1 Tax=Pleuronectes platessa TaxID=8262 RepID=A0A9N7UBN7_PLEPL|nr:unnamed protein product [Pleuronectes platessa]